MLGIELINKCNFKCYFCDSQYVESHRTLTNSEFFKITDQAKEIGIKYLDLTPIDGELFMDETFMEKLEYILPDFEVTFHTNFSLCNPYIIDGLKIFQEKYDLEIVISDYYSDGLEAFKKLTNKGAQQFLMYQKNLAYAQQQGLELNIKYRGLDYGYTIDSSYTVSDIKRTGICSLQYIPSIKMNGDMDYCLCGDGNLTNKGDLYLGNIYESSLETVYYSMKRKELFKEQSKDIYNESCSNCDLFETNNIEMNSLKHYSKMGK